MAYAMPLLKITLMNSISCIGIFGMGGKMGLSMSLLFEPAGWIQQQRTRNFHLIGLYINSFYFLIVTNPFPQNRSGEDFHFFRKQVINMISSRFQQVMNIFASCFQLIVSGTYFTFPHFYTHVEAPVFCEKHLLGPVWRPGVNLFLNFFNNG